MVLPVRGFSIELRLGLSDERRLCRGLRLGRWGRWLAAKMLLGLMSRRGELGFVSEL